MTAWTRADLHNRQVSRGHWLAKVDGEAFDFTVAGTTHWLVFRAGDAAPIVRGPTLEAAEDALVTWIREHDGAAR